ncbi:MAG: hypothetical protein JHC33_12675 [Ignisphaera sp.]|jgi:microcystin-dependent protein|nr:hypothetical protein [Ignisphaera sp.]
MSNCQNCFNGCTETISDQCVKYTGINVPELGISTGDPLSVIEQSLTTFLVSALNGTGIKIDLSGIDICTLVQQYLPTCGEMSIADISKALVQAVCNIQEQIDAIVAELAILNADYTIDCLTEVTASSDTHAIVQAVITKLCTIDTNLTELITEVDNQYVKKTELCSLVTECMSGESGTDLASAKMLPYSIIPYYGPASGYPTVSDGFSSTGAGYGYWLNVYLCNGGNPGVPDLRGRVAVGATDMATATWPMSGQTQPGVNNNPTYEYKDPATGIQGSNFTTLTLAQIPAHNHTTSTASSTAITTIPPHTHSILGITGGDNSDNNNTVRFAGGDKNQTEPGFFFTNIQACQSATLSATTTLTILPQGQGEKHSNVQPGLAVYYLIYIPA